MFYPMFAMVILTFIVAFYLVSIRIHAVRSKLVSAGYFRLNKGPHELPAHIVAAANHFSNLFELPLLFYVTCMLVVSTNLQGSLMLGLAWAFVISRVVHTIIHLTYNNVVHRMLAFLVGGLCVLAMWIIMAIAFSTG